MVEQKSGPNGNQKRSMRAKTSLLDAASDLMRSLDTIDITLAQVSDIAGVNAALVRYHFGNKEGLLFAVLERDVKQSRDAMRKLIKRTDIGAKSKMELHLTGLVHAYYKIPYLNRLMQHLTRGASDERVDKIGQEFVKPIVAAQTQILSEGVDQGVFHQVDPASFYFAVICAASGLYEHRFILKEAFGIDEITKDTHQKNVHTVVRLLLRGICSEGNPPICGAVRN